MKKLSSFLVFFLIIVLIQGFAPVKAGIDVTPVEYNFGDVDLGDIASQNFEISNNWWGDLTIASVTLTGGSGNYVLLNPPPSGTTVAPGSSIIFGVEFFPSQVGFTTAVITIHWTNGETGISEISLSGMGVAPQSPVSIQDILNFFDASVANGTLMGAGSGNSADGRLNALRNMLVKTSYLISAGNYEGACEQLNDALKRCDDFVQGASQDDLAQMISDLMDGLGC